MRYIYFITRVLFVLTLVLYAGCEDQPAGAQLSLDFVHSNSAICSRYGPAHVDVLPITTVSVSSENSRDSTINAYVCLLDSFNSQIKAPVTLRFELFQHVKRSADPKGKRLAIWPDIDLTDPAVNNSRWQDFLRAYLFSLPLQRPSSAGDTYVLQVTCFCLSGKRLSADFLVRPAR
jgi:hypothetical protein